MALYESNGPKTNRIHTITGSYAMPMLMQAVLEIVNHPPWARCGGSTPSASALTQHPTLGAHTETIGLACLLMGHMPTALPHTESYTLGRLPSACHTKPHEVGLGPKAQHVSVRPLCEFQVKSKGALYSATDMHTLRSCICHPAGLDRLLLYKHAGSLRSNLVICGE